MGLNVEITYPKWDLDKRADDNLFVLIGANRLSYMVLSEKEELLLLKSYSNPSAQKGIEWVIVREWMNDDPALQNSYAQVVISMDTDKTTTVPAPFFAAQNARILLQEVAAVSNEEIVEHVLIEELNAYQLFARPQRVIEPFRKHSELVGVNHLYVPLIRYLFNENKLLRTSPEAVVFIHFMDKRMHILAGKGRQLLLSNSFEYVDANDALYYVLLVYKQLNLDTQKSPAVLSGTIMKASVIYNTLYKYIEQISFSGAPDTVVGGAGLQQWPKHYFTDLLSLPLCASLEES